MTKIAFVGRKDYAVCAQRAATAINTVSPGAAIAITWEPHHLGYKGQIVEKGQAQAIDRAISFLDGATNPWVVSMASGRHGDMGAGMSTHLATGCRHGRLYIGTEFRLNSARLLDIDRRAGVDLCIISPDSMHLADEKIRCVPYLHTVPEIEETELSPITGPVRICHSPSSLTSKGTSAIRSMVYSQSGKASLVYTEIHGVAYEECLRLRAGGHIFIGQLNSDVGGFGYSSVEAMAQGMVALATRGNAPDSVWVAAGLDPPPVLHLTPSALHAACSNQERLHGLRLASHHYVHRGQMSATRAGEYYLSVFT